MAGKKTKRKQVHVKTSFSSPSPRHAPSNVSSCDSEMGFCASSPADAACDPQIDSDLSTTTCRHMERGIDVDKLSSQVSKAKFSVSHCQDCAKSGAGKKGKGRSSRKKEGAVKEDSEAYLRKNWLCLACGHVACGTFSDLTNKKPNEQVAVQDSEMEMVVPTGHVCKHALCSRHPLALETTDKLVWCFVCKMAVDCKASSGSDNGNSQSICGCPLHSAQQIVQERLAKKTGFLKDPGKTVVVGDIVQSDRTFLGRPDVSYSRPLIGLYSPRIRKKRIVKGLMNLGNTCFFNSVMQNLLALDMLRDYFSQELSRLQGPLSSSLRKLYQETNLDDDQQFCTSTLEPLGHDSGLKKGAKDRAIRENIGSACNPRALFGAICTKAPRFRGFQQQDSHELLRCLLDGLASEERSTGCRYTHSSEDTNKARSASPDGQVQNQTGEGIIPEFTSAEKDCQKSEHTTPLIMTAATAVDKFFGGQLCSTVCCCKCGHSSVVFETMLDLSLPLPNPKRGQKGVIPSKMLSFGGGSQQRSHQQKEVLPNTSFHNVSHSSGPSVVDDDSSRSLQGSQSAQASLTVLPSMPSPLSSTPVTADNDSGWLEFVGGGMQSAESSIQGFRGVDNGVELSESSSTADLRDPYAARLGNVELSSATTSAEGEIFEDGTEMAVLNSEVHDSKSVIKKAEACTCLNSSEEIGENPIPLSQEDDGPLPTASGVILLPYKPLGMSRTSSVVFESALKCRPEDMLSPSPELEESYLDGFSQLFEEEESCVVAIENLRPCNEIEYSQVIDDSAWEDRTWEADAAVHEPGSQIVADADDAILPMSLEGCLSDFTKPELLSGENAWECEGCTRRIKEKMCAMRCGYSVSAGDNNEELFSMCQNNSINWESTTVNGKLGPEHIFSKVYEVTIGGESNRFGGCIPVHQVADRIKDDENLDNPSGKSDDGEDTVNCSFPRQIHVNHAEIPTTGQDCGSALQCNGFTTSKRPSSFNSCLGETGHKGCSNVKSLIHGENVPTSQEKLMMGAKYKVKNRCLSEKLVKQDATKRLSISKAPLILTVHLKRFAQDIRGRLSKLSGHVTFPETLDLRPFLDSRCLYSNSCFYQLVGVVEHGGTMRGGHYVAYVRSPSHEEKIDGTEQEANDVWYYISDLNVRKASLQAVLNAEAYLLFYEKHDIMGKNDI